MQHGDDRRDKLPDSRDKKGRCPRCGVVATFFGAVKTSNLLKGGDERVLDFKCNNCGGLVVVIERVLRMVAVPDPDENKRRIAAATNRPQDALKNEPEWSVVGSWPLRDAEPPDYVPPEIGELYREAATSLSAACYRGAVALTRAAVDAAITDQGGKGKWLHDRIQSMKGKLRDQLIEVADELKIGGNAAAHDFDQKFSEEEASERFRFLVEVLRELYETPLRIKNVRQLGANRPAVKTSTQ